MNPREFEAALADAEGRLRRLRTLYDQWFAGVERFEPQADRTQFDTLMTRMQRNMPNNTALRYRVQQLNHRYQTYTTYWARVARQIEEGTYHRDVMKARRRRELRQQQEQREAQRGAGGAMELDDNLDVQSALDDAEAAVKKREAARAAAAQRGRAGSNGELSDDQIQQVYKRYIAARAKNAERTDNVKVETVAKSLRNMMPKLRAKHGDRPIDFEVVVKNGRVALKPKAG